jgi:PLD-like domain
MASVFAISGSSSAAPTAKAATPAIATATAAKSARVVGRPPMRYTIPANSYFSYPNGAKQAIRAKVLATIKSTWGGPRQPGNGLPADGNGTIRIATWSFKDWAMAHALVAAKNRGVSVQVVAARGRNKDNAEWRFLKKKLGSRLNRPGYPATVDKVSFARDCRGSCRGRGGTPHAKYFMFTNVGPYHVAHTVIQTSMNLTVVAYRNQWNQAEVSHDAAIYNAFMAIYRETRIGTPRAAPHRRYVTGQYVNEFFPYHANSRTDPVMKLLDPVRCTGATAGGTANHRTRIRIIMYSIYGPRGVWIAKRLRSLWNQGCDIKMIYAISSRPTIAILRNHSGRGAIPLKQSVITNGQREIVKYNHSKWMTIAGHYGSNTGAFLTMSGSSNFSLFGLNGDEQVQTINSRYQAGRHIGAFTATWKQGSSHAPGFGIKGSEGRMTEKMWLQSIPKKITWGKGIYKYVSPEGE